MKTLLLAGTITLLLATAAQAQKSGIDAQTKSLLADANGDGKITSAEYQASRRAFLMRADRDKDGRVSRAEFDREARAIRGAVAMDDPDGARQIGSGTWFVLIDANKDGFITPGEINAMTAARFASLDPNHDGVITTWEASKLRRNTGTR